MALFNKKKKYSKEADVTPVNLEDEFTNLFIGLNTYVSESKNWDPSVSAISPMTYSATVYNARYRQIGKNIFFNFRAYGTTGGTASTRLTFNLPPVNPLYDTSGYIGGGCYVIDGLGLLYAGTWVHTGSGSCAVRRYDNGNFGIGTDRAMVVQGFYEIK